MLPKNGVEIDSGLIPGGQKGIRFYGLKIKISIQKLLNLFKKKKNV
ncbi:MAG: hypothetical protein M0R17_06470 [Candidatus Omnitrophica bacterium]|jgi:hypothetical protein|nr:hypothetical protein [Candidatus Omnitrophota bacterium]